MHTTQDEHIIQRHTYFIKLVHRLPGYALSKGSDKGGAT